MGLVSSARRTSVVVEDGGGEAAEDACAELRRQSHRRHNFTASRDENSRARNRRNRLIYEQISTKSLVGILGCRFLVLAPVDHVPGARRRRSRSSLLLLYDCRSVRRERRVSHLAKRAWRSWRVGSRAPPQRPGRRTQDVRPSRPPIYAGRFGDAHPGFGIGVATSKSDRRARRSLVTGVQKSPSLTLASQATQTCTRCKVMAAEEERSMVARPQSPEEARAAKRDWQRQVLAPDKQGGVAPAGGAQWLAPKRRESATNLHRRGGRKHDVDDRRLLRAARAAKRCRRASTSPRGSLQPRRPAPAEVADPTEDR